MVKRTVVRLVVYGTALICLVTAGAQTSQQAGRIPYNAKVILQIDADAGPDSPKQAGTLLEVQEQSQIVIDFVSCRCVGPLEVEIYPEVQVTKSQSGTVPAVDLEQVEHPIPITRKTSYSNDTDSWVTHFASQRVRIHRADWVSLVPRIALNAPVSVSVVCETLMASGRSADCSATMGSHFSDRLWNAR